MRMLLTAIALFALALPAQAGIYEYPPGSGEWWEVPDIPPEWANRQFDGKIDIAERPIDEVSKVCAWAVEGPEENFFGCAWPTEGRCDILMADDLPPDLHEAVLAEEKAHCVGYRH